jgi:hypothetical protein
VSDKGSHAAATGDTRGNTKAGIGSAFATDVLLARTAHVNRAMK